MIRVDTGSGSWVNPEAAEEGKQLRLVAVGDVCPTRGRRHDELFCAGRETVEKVYGDTLGELAKKDLSLVNFELPLSDGGEPIIKNGPNLIGPPRAIEGFVVGGFDVAGMANNHVLDYGPEPFRQTIELIGANGMAVVGAGRNVDEASRPLFIERAGVNVGIIALEENEFCNATRRTPGANPYRPGPNGELIRRTRDECDLLIVYVHGGSEYCPIPSPRTIRDYRSFVDAGADAIIAHHAHTVQGLELYRGAPIVYNLGNFIFWSDPKTVTPMWWKQMFVRLTFFGRRCVRLDVHPVKMDFDTAGIGLLKGDEKKAFLERLNRISEIVADPELHDRFWGLYCLGQMPFYLGLMEREVADVLYRPDRRQASADLRNLFQCEAHSDVISCGLEMIRQGRKKGSFGVEAEWQRLTS